MEEFQMQNSIIYVVAGYVSAPSYYGTALYEVTTSGDELISVEKIDFAGYNLVEKKQVFEKRDCFSITLRHGAICHDWSGSCRVDSISSAKKGAKTRPIIGLFYDKVEATKCLNLKDLKNWDERFWSSTEMVLKDIGTEVGGPLALDRELLLAIKNETLSEVAR